MKKKTTAIKQNIHFTEAYLREPTHPITVNLIGCGGTGSQVLTSLARINQALIALGHPGLMVNAYDADTVTEANIARQLFSPSDLGLNKAKVLITRLNRFFATDWIAYPDMYNRNCFSANITISCVDTISARIEISFTKAYHTNVFLTPFYWLDFGNGRSSGQFVLGSFNKIKQPASKKYKTIPKLKLATELFDYSKVDEADSGPSCSLSEALAKQDLFINSSLSHLGCSLLWQLLSKGWIDYQGAFLNLDTMRTNPIKL